MKADMRKRAQEHTRPVQERMRQLEDLLLAGGFPTMERLAEELGVDRRTVYRDIRSLRKMGCPIHLHPERHGYHMRGRRVGSIPSLVVTPRGEPLADGEPLKECLAWIDKQIEPYERADRRFVTNRGSFPLKGCAIFDQLVTRCVLVFDPSALQLSLEEQVDLLRTKTKEFTSLIQQELGHCLRGKTLLSGKELKLIEDLQGLRCKLLKPASSPAELRQRYASLMDDLARKLKALRNSNFVQTICAVEPKRAFLVPREHAFARKLPADGL